MWISKKKWNEMCKRIDSIEYIERDLYSHIFNIQNVSTNVNTELIKNVTLEELARYVIDETPIVREETINIKKEYR